MADIIDFRSGPNPRGEDRMRRRARGPVSRGDAEEGKKQLEQQEATRRAQEDFRKESIGKNLKDGPARLRPAERPLVAERMYKILSDVKGTLSETGKKVTKTAIAHEAGLGDESLASSRLRQYTIRPGLRGERRKRHVRQLTLKTRGYLKLAEAAARLGGYLDDHFLVELFEDTQFDPKKEELENIEPYYKFISTIRELARRISKKHDLPGFRREVCIKVQGFRPLLRDLTPDKVRLYALDDEWSAEAEIEPSADLESEDEFGRDNVCTAEDDFDSEAQLQPNADSNSGMGAGLDRDLVGIDEHGFFRGLDPSVPLYRFQLGDPLPVELTVSTRPITSEQRAELFREPLRWLDYGHRIERLVEENLGQREFKTKKAWLCAFCEVRLGIGAGFWADGPFFERRYPWEVRTADDKEALLEEHGEVYVPLTPYLSYYGLDGLDAESHLFEHGGHLYGGKLSIFETDQPFSPEDDDGWYGEFVLNPFDMRTCQKFLVDWPTKNEDRAHFLIPAPRAENILVPHLFPGGSVGSLLENNLYLTGKNDPKRIDNLLDQDATSLVAALDDFRRRNAEEVALRLEKLLADWSEYE